MSKPGCLMHGCRIVAYVETVDHVHLAVDRALVGTWTTLSVTAATSSVTKASVVQSAARLTGILHSPRCCCAPSASGEFLVFDAKLLLPYLYSPFVPSECCQAMEVSYVLYLCVYFMIWFGVVGIMYCISRIWINQVPWKSVLSFTTIVSDDWTGLPNWVHNPKLRANFSF